MIKERIPLSGDLKNKVKQLMIYAGWYEGRKVDISIASQYYAERGVPMMKSTRLFTASILVVLSVVLFWWNEARCGF